MIYFKGLSDEKIDKLAAAKRELWKQARGKFSALLPLPPPSLSLPPHPHPSTLGLGANSVEEGQ